MKNIKYENRTLTVPTEGGVYEGTPENTVIYAFSELYAGVDHIFVQTSETEEQVLGVYIFRIANDAFLNKFDDLTSTMVTDGFPILCQETPPECDQRQFEAALDIFIAHTAMQDLDEPWNVK